MKGHITQDNHAFFTLANEPLKSVIGASGRGTRPRHHQAVCINDAEHGRSDQKGPRSVLMGRAETHEPGALGSAGEEHRSWRVDQ